MDPSDDFPDRCWYIPARQTQTVRTRVVPPPLPTTSYSEARSWSASSPAAAPAGKSRRAPNAHEPHTDAYTHSSTEKSHRRHRQRHPTPRPSPPSSQTSHSSTSTERALLSKSRSYYDKPNATPAPPTARRAKSKPYQGRGPGKIPPLPIYINELDTSRSWYHPRPRPESPRKDTKNAKERQSPSQMNGNMNMKDDKHVGQGLMKSWYTTFKNRLSRL